MTPFTSTVTSETLPNLFEPQLYTLEMRVIILTLQGKEGKYDAQVKNIIEVLTQCQELRVQR